MNEGTAEDKRTCTCHPDDNPPFPCPRRYAYNECIKAALAEEVRQYTAMKYMGDCKCGKCQLVPRQLLERIYHTLNGSF